MISVPSFCILLLVAVHTECFSIDKIFTRTQGESHMVDKLIKFGDLMEKFSKINPMGLQERHQISIDVYMRLEEDVQQELEKEINAYIADNEDNVQTSLDFELSRGFCWKKDKWYYILYGPWVVVSVTGDCQEYDYNKDKEAKLRAECAEMCFQWTRWTECPVMCDDGSGAGKHSRAGIRLNTTCDVVFEDFRCEAAEPYGLEVNQEVSVTEWCGAARADSHMGCQNGGHYDMHAGRCVCQPDAHGACCQHQGRRGLF